MFREFNVKFEDVEMLGGADNLLEGTEITKVIVRGDNNKMSSLDSMLKNCNELDTIDGELDLNGVSDIDNLLEGTELVKSIDLKNINNENISANNSFPYVESVNIGGELYNKKAMQNVIASKDWTFDNINYSGTVGDNIVTKEVNIVDDNKATIQDTLEQKARGFEIIGQTYENLVEGSGEATLLDELTLESIDGSPNEFTPHIEQPVCLESIEGETYQNLIEGKGEYKLTDTFITTWTESNNSIENPPSMIEIPEIWGNTVQGYANVVTAKMIVDSINNSTWTDGNSAELSSTDSKLYKATVANSNGIDTNNISWIQLKANTTYSVTHYSTVYKTHFGAYVRYYENPSTVINIGIGGSFTTGSSGKVFLYPVGYQGQWNWIRCVEGKVDLSNYNYDEMDLNYIQSVGDLYVDESGEPILDEEGNEQYKLEIESTDNVNILDYELGYDIGLYNDDGTFDTTQTRERTGKHYVPVKEGRKYIFYKGDGVQFGQWFKIYAFDNEKNFIGRLSNDHASSIFYYTIPKGRNIKYIKICITDIWDTPHIIEDGKEIKFYGSGKGLTNKTTILMPQPLMRFQNSDISGRPVLIYDKIYKDLSNSTYFIDSYAIYKEFNGSESWGLQDFHSTTDNRFVLPNAIPEYTSKVGSTQGIYPYCNMATTSKVIIDNTSLSIWVSKSEFPTLESFKEYLSKNTLKLWLSNGDVVFRKGIKQDTSLETYSPKTYISTNTEIQPSKMTITNKKVDFIPLGLQPNKDYTLQLDSIGKEDKPITVNLGGAETTIQPINDTSKHHKVVVRTPSELTTDKLDLSGEGVVVNDVMLFEGGGNEIKQEVEYVEGIESIGEYYLDYYLNLDVFTDVIHNEYYKIQGRDLTILKNDGRAGNNGVLLDVKNGEYTVDANENINVQIFDENGVWKTQVKNGDIINIDAPIKVKVVCADNIYPTTTHFNLLKNNSAYEETYKIDILSNDDLFANFLYDKSKNINGYELTGATNDLQVNANKATTDFIKVPNNGEYYINTSKTIQPTIFQYDENKNYIPYDNNGVRVYDPWQWSTIYNGEYYTQHMNNTHYIRISLNLTDVDCLNISLNNDKTFPSPVGKSTTQSILLPQPLNKIGELKDKFYWDENKGHYCIEQNINENLEVLDTPNIVDLPHLNKKYSVDTYMPTTYLECTNSPMQPSRLLLESDTVRYKPSTLETDTDYTIQFECKEKSDKKVKLNLGGSEKEVDAIVGLNHVSMTTPSEIDTSLYKDRLFLSGVGNKVADVIVAKGEMSQYPNYFDGVQNTGELQDDGTYKIDVETYSQTNNIFNPNQKYVDGKFINDNGVEQINTGYGYTIDFIKSNPNTRYVGQNTSCIYCYDDNKQFISRIPFWGNGTIVSSATPSNCYYVRFQLEWSKLPNKDLRLHKVAEGNSVIDIDDWKSFTISVISNNPLAKGDKLYWNKSNKRYEIDRSGSIEVPSVTGDIIDLPRLYQREDTHFSTSTGNIKPSKIKLDYNDLD